jgi:hypothetical protein
LRSVRVTLRRPAWRRASLSSGVSSRLDWKVWPTVIGLSLPFCSPGLLDWGALSVDWGPG